jgi:urea carboxylase
MEGQTLMVIEIMKVEIDITAPGSGVIRALRCPPGHAVIPGQVLALIGAAVDA